MVNEFLVIKTHSGSHINDSNSIGLHLFSTICLVEKNLKATFIILQLITEQETWNYFPGLESCVLVFFTGSPVLADIPTQFFYGI